MISGKLIESFGYTPEGFIGKAVNTAVGGLGAADTYDRTQAGDTGGAVTSGISTVAALAGLPGLSIGIDLMQAAYDAVKGRRLAKERGEPAADAEVADDDILGQVGKWATTPMWGDNAEKEQPDEIPVPDTTTAAPDISDDEMDTELGAELDKLNESAIVQITKLRKKLQQLSE
jgi:hypothetical protein